ncbi:LysR substrate-binding domain-containing protein [Vibrio splendidus]|uniref:LysR substrate-binding domain-containing protein n=1 Tax=Vibrio splendidus TaxID=29497 RepID=UPI000976D338|nr:LysR substrate-binding domain-containing protein [Vibrio splendidus]OMO19609.1 LysR family transcriptional regulator [Vibrio splendidus]PMG28973.1 LysR family transcriptional regulator [Vibrio splendidus]PMI83258.1 LysR family transcriptional regulator [Vibrio splendidus]PMK10015.1 LysR family transcriptional regulator [Vibrio splendidus]PMK61087.1 LysR family transcriptional regulator [Vibrio splendidus]
MKHSDFNLIPIFVTVMEERNISKAAHRLNISQSAVSQSINRLKILFNDPLFFRESHGVSPSKLANSIYPQLSAAVHQIKLTAPPLSDFNAETSSRKFMISTVSVLGLSILPVVSSLIFNQSSNIKVKVDSNLAHKDMHSLLRNQYDLSIDIDHGQYPELKSQEILQEELCVLCHVNHPRLTNQKVSLEQFLSEKHVVHTTFNQKQPYLYNKGLNCEGVIKQRDIAWSANNIVEMMSIIENSHHIGLFPKTLLNKYLKYSELKLIPCDFISENIRVAMFWHPAQHYDIGHRWLRELISEANYCG